MSTEPGQSEPPSQLSNVPGYKRCSEPARSTELAAIQGTASRTNRLRNTHNPWQQAQQVTVSAPHTGRSVGVLAKLLGHCTSVASATTATRLPLEMLPRKAVQRGALMPMVTDNRSGTWPGRARYAAIASN